jgi:hypothetical protein
MSNVDSANFLEVLRNLVDYQKTEAETRISDNELRKEEIEVRKKELEYEHLAAKEVMGYQNDTIKDTNSKSYNFAKLLVFLSAGLIFIIVGILTYLIIIGKHEPFMAFLKYVASFLLGLSGSLPSYYYGKNKALANNNSDNIN